MKWLRRLCEALPDFDTPNETPDQETATNENWARNLMQEYRRGVGYKHGDVLVPKAGAKVHTFGVREDTVVVERQDALAPHEYTVIGERLNPGTPADRFVRFTINGHNWKRK